MVTVFIANVPVANPKFHACPAPEFPGDKIEALTSQEVELLPIPGNEFKLKVGCANEMPIDRQKIKNTQSVFMVMSLSNK